MNHRRATSQVLLYTVLATSVNAFNEFFLVPLKTNNSLLKSHSSIVTPSIVEVEWEFVTEPPNEWHHENLPFSGDDNFSHQESAPRVTDGHVYKAVFCGYECTDEERMRLRSANIDENPIDDYSI
mmetsp:Transcript_27369/g.40410  ORF Transcript_27369/g.40410 Transcript_27369/m.40410 type:complete len:125 (-) Transcript_27369:1190-1564(-)